MMAVRDFGTAGRLRMMAAGKFGTAERLRMMAVRDCGTAERLRMIAVRGCAIHGAIGPKVAACVAFSLHFISQGYIIGITFDQEGYLEI